MVKKSLIQLDKVASCYFRTSVEYPYRKALIQITEKCNLLCSHCFVSAGNFGETMDYEIIKKNIIPRLKTANVVSVTLTGGEPFVHPNIIEIAEHLRMNDIEVGICTNATLITQEQALELKNIGGVHVNVSLDGFSPLSHGKFRNNKESFYQTKETLKLLSEHRLLQGILSTPNNLIASDEYSQICEFATTLNCKYVLMNPIAKMGRGVKSFQKLSASSEFLEEIRRETMKFKEKLEIVHIRFRQENLPLSSCEAGRMLYVFVNGDVAICPYLVFAANSPISKHSPKEFIVGNIIHDSNFSHSLQEYDFHKKYRVGENSSCNSCELNQKCGKGCPAAVVANGEYIGQVDTEVCPKTEGVDYDF